MSLHQLNYAISFFLTIKTACKNSAYQYPWVTQELEKIDQLSISASLRKCMPLIMPLNIPKSCTKFVFMWELVLDKLHLKLLFQI